MAIYQYLDSLRDDIRKQVKIWEITQRCQDKPATLTDYMRQAAVYDAIYPVPKKGRRQGKS